MAGMIPEIDRRTGYLPPGVHTARWAEVAERFGGNERRRALLLGLENALAELAGAGCRAVLLNGSFVTEKREPSDYDGVWEPEGVNKSRLDPVFRNWSRRGRAKMKSKYGGELFPADAEAAVGISYRDFFQSDRRDIRKGIVGIDPRELL